MLILLLLLYFKDLLTTVADLLLNSEVVAYSGISDSICVWNSLPPKMEALLMSHKGFVTDTNAHQVSCRKDNYVLANGVSNLTRSWPIKHHLASYNQSTKLGNRKSKETDVRD